MTRQTAVMLPCPWCGREGYDRVFFDESGVPRHDACGNDVRTQTIERFTRAASVIGPDPDPLTVPEPPYVQERADRIATVVVILLILAVALAVAVRVVGRT